MKPSTPEQELRQDFIQFFIKAGALGPNARLFQAIKAVLYLEPEPISLEEIAKHTRYSLSAVSTALQTLEQVGAVERRRRPGSRKVYYFMRKEMGPLLASSLRRTVMHAFSIGDAEMPELLKKYKKHASGKGTKRFRQIYTLLKDYYRQLQSLEEVFENLLKEMEAID